jgi:hypothetical protein
MKFSYCFDAGTGKRLESFLERGNRWRFAPSFVFLRRLSGGFVPEEILPRRFLPFYTFMLQAWQRLGSLRAQPYLIKLPVNCYHQQFYLRARGSL